MLDTSSRELVPDSTLGRLFFCSLCRCLSALFERVRALLLLRRLTGGAFREAGSVFWAGNVPGCKISKPVPCPRKMVESRFSKDDRCGAAGFAGIAVVYASWRVL